MNDQDSYPIPSEEDRELYYPGRDDLYWSHSLEQAGQIMDTMHRPAKMLDFGGASGRVARHLKYQFKTDVTLCDSNPKHIKWVTDNLPGIPAVESTGYPHLPFADNSFDGIIALSVFTHIAKYDTTWLAELARILRPLGTLLLTVHTEQTWERIDKEHILYKYLRNHKEYDHEHPPFRDRLVFSFGDNHYYHHVFTHSNYIRKVWGRILPIREIKYNWVTGQDTIVFTK